MKIFLLLLLLAMPAWAHLGDTRDESIARYGNPVGENVGLAIFIKGNRYLIITFVNGVVEKMQVMPYAPPPYSKLDFSKKEVQELLDENGGGLWVPVTGLIENGEIWKSIDGRVATKTGPGIVTLWLHGGEVPPPAK